MRRLSFAEEPLQKKQGVWSENEVKALVEFVLLYSNTVVWPTHKELEFWESAAEFVKNRVKSTSLRSGKSIVYMVCH